MYFAHELEIRPADKLDKRAQERLIEFNPEWIDPEGLPTRLHAWVLDNMTSGEFCYGVRWAGSRPHRFTIMRSDAKLSAYSDVVNFTATFELRQNYTLEVRPGCITYRDSFGTVQRKYVEYTWDGETTWKQDIEVKRLNHVSYIDCPAILGFALAQIDSMVYSLTKMETRRPSVLLEMMAPGYRDAANCRPTPEAIQQVYSFVRGLRAEELMTPINTERVRKAFNITLESEDPTPEQIAAAFVEIMKTPESYYAWIIQEIQKIASEGIRKPGEKIDFSPTSFEKDFHCDFITKSLNPRNAVQQVLGRADRNKFQDIPQANAELSKSEEPSEYNNNWIADPKPPTE